MPIEILSVADLHNEMTVRVRHLENVVDILMRVAYVNQDLLTDEDREALSAYRDRNAGPLPPSPPPPSPPMRASTVWDRLDDNL